MDKKKTQLQSVIYVFSVILSFPRTLNIMVISCVSMYLSKIKNGMQLARIRLKSGDGGCRTSQHHSRTAGMLYLQPDLEQDVY